MAATQTSRPAHASRTTWGANEDPCWGRVQWPATPHDQRLPSPSLGPPLLSASWSPPLSWEIPLMTAGALATGGAGVGGGAGTVVGGTVAGGVGTVVGGTGGVGGIGVAGGVGTVVGEVGKLVAGRSSASGGAWWWGGRRRRWRGGLGRRGGFDGGGVGVRHEPEPESQASGHEGRDHRDEESQSFGHLTSFEMVWAVAVRSRPRSRVSNFNTVEAAQEFARTQRS